MSTFNKTERKYIDRLFELKPHCSGQELIDLIDWMDTKDMKRFDENHGHIRDLVILEKQNR